MRLREVYATLVYAGYHHPGYTHLPPPSRVHRQPRPASNVATSRPVRGDGHTALTRVVVKLTISDEPLTVTSLSFSSSLPGIPSMRGFSSFGKKLRFIGAGTWCTHRCDGRCTGVTDGAQVCLTVVCRTVVCRTVVSGIVTPAQSGPFITNSETGD